MRKHGMFKKLTSLVLGLFMVMGLVFVPAINVSASPMSGTSTISTSGNHTLAIQSDGSLWAWGGNHAGQIGDGTRIDRHTPIKIMDDVVYVHANSSGASFAIKTDGSLWAWGSNAFGMLGDGTTTARNSPVRIMENVVSVSSAAWGGHAIMADGSLWGWGTNNFGQLGDGTTINRLSPVHIMDDVVSVSRSGGFGFAVKTDGSVWGWGSNLLGALAIDSSADLGSNPGQWGNDIHPSPIRIIEGGVISVSAGTYYGLALKQDGGLWAWGSNGNNRINASYEGVILTPTQIMEGVLYATSSGTSTFAILSDNSLWAWGGGYHGTGSGWSVESEPVRVMSNISYVSSSDSGVRALATDGSVWSWGRNLVGQIGDGTASIWETPTLALQITIILDNERYTPVRVLDNVRLPNHPVPTIGVATTQPPTQQQNQVLNLATASTWAVGSITQAHTHGLIPQSLQTNFTANATRAEFAAFAVALYETVTGREITERATFNDTNDINVQKMGGLGVVGGVGNGNFNPNGTITRQEAAVMLSRLIAQIDQPLPIVAPTFADNAQIASWATEAAGQIQAAGIMGGVGNNQFNPTENFTREQSIITMLRLFEELN